MKTQTHIALALFVLEAAAFSYFTRTTLFPLLVSIAVLLSFLPQFPVRLNLKRPRILFLLLAVFFLIKAIRDPYDPVSMNTFLAYSYVHAIAQFFLSVQALQF